MADAKLVILLDALCELQPRQILQRIVTDPQLLQTLGLRSKLVEALCCLYVYLIIVQEQFLEFWRINQRFEDKVDSFVPDPIHLQSECIDVLLLG